ncbi:MAG: hypothetical protein ACREB6_08460, partial [Rhodospirillales bacterium]
MAYRDFSISNGGRQSDGFFVDDDDRILFWPDKRPPGYILDRTTAENVFRFNNRLLAFGAPSRLVFFVPALFALVASAPFFMLENNVFGFYRFFDGIFSPKTAFFVFALVLVTLYLVSLVVVDKSYARRGFSRLLVGCAAIDVPRPVHLNIYVPMIGRFELYSLIVLALVSALSIWKGIVETDDRPGDRIFVVFMGLLFAAMTLGMVWLMRRETRVSVEVKARDGDQPRNALLTEDESKAVLGLRSKGKNEYDRPPTFLS